MGDKNEVWVIGRSFWCLEDDNKWSWTWDLHGVFRDRKKAEDLCKNEHWFIVPTQLDQPFPEEPREFPGLVVPNDAVAAPLQYRRSGQTFTLV